MMTNQIRPDHNASGCSATKQVTPAVKLLKTVDASIGAVAVLLRDSNRVYGLLSKTN